jgi:outer membrane protein assembly factor BamB
VLDAKTGDIRHKIARDEPTSWNTPLVMEHQGVTQVIVNGTKRARGYDLATGKVLWECGEQSVNAIPSPVPGKGVVYCMSGYQSSECFAIPLDARGDISNTKKILWHLTQGTPYVPSALLVKDRLYFNFKNTPMLSCVNAKDGEVIFRQRLPQLETLYASPVAAAGRIYLVDRTGTTVVIEQADELKVLAVNSLKSGIDGSPAVAGNQMFLRGHDCLYCLEEARKN